MKLECLSFVDGEANPALGAYVREFPNHTFVFIRDAPDEWKRLFTCVTQMRCIQQGVQYFERLDFAHCFFLKALANDTARQGRLPQSHINVVRQCLEDAAAGSQEIPARPCPIREDDIALDLAIAESRNNAAIGERRDVLCRS